MSEDLIKKTNEELGGIVYNKIKEAIYRFDPSVISIRERHEKLRLYIPMFAFELLKRYTRVYCNNFEYALTDRSVNKFMGYEIIIGYESKIILAHEDYAKFKDKRLISSIDL